MQTVVLVLQIIALLAICIAVIHRSISTAPCGSQEDGVFRYLPDEECQPQKAMNRLYSEDLIAK